MRSLKRFFTFRQGKVSARRYAKEQARLRAGLERGLEKSLVRMFNRRLKAVTDALKAELIPDLDVTAVPLAEEMTEVLNDRIRRTFRTVYDYNNDRYKDLNTKGEVSFGFGFGNNAEYDSYISSYLQGRQSYITNISQRMGRSIVGDINSLREEGLTLPQISREISAKYRRINRSRATTIARTETHSATGAAHDNYHRQVASSYGVLMKKQWVATSDARTRGAHAAMNGVTVEMDETFKMPNGTEMNYVGDTAGGPSNVVNCRCVILYVDTEDELPDTDEANEVTVNSDGITVDSKGRPIGMTLKEFNKGFESQSYQDASKAAMRRLRKRIKASAEGKWLDPEWAFLNDFQRFEGIKSDGKVSRALSPKDSDGFAFHRGMTMLSSIQPELDQLADTFNIPRTKSIRPVHSKSAIADMGDASMGWNKNWITSFGGRDQTLASKWRRGDPMKERPYTAMEYMDNTYDQMRATAYHEFGHQVHQLYGTNRFSRGTSTEQFLSYRRPPVEERLKKVDISGGPSEYSQENEREWFAENFAMWAMRREDLVDPQFTVIIDDLLKGAKDGKN